MPPAPRADRPDTILVFAPHPDDETLGCGGYVAQSIDAGKRVVIVVLTMGEKLFSHGLHIESDPSPAEIRRMRREESLRATAILGVAPANVIFLEFEDRSLEANAAAVGERVATMLKAMRPVEVLCTGPYEAHVDHRAACTIVRNTCALVLPKVRLRWYITSLQEGTALGDLPGTMERIDIRPQLSRKTQAVAQFRAHLDRISPQQTAPIVSDFNQYLDGTEILLSP